jgi:parvulin-like peptidyl-prolyl isomerase
MKEAVRSIVLGTKGAAKAEDVSRLVTSDLATNKNIEAVAQKNGVEVRTTPFLTAGQKVDGLSNSPEFMRQVFSLAKDEIGTAVKNDEGYAIPSVAEIQPSHPGTFDETKARVLTDVKTEKAGQMATEKSKEAVDAVKAGKDLSTVAKSLGMDVKTSEPLARGGSLPDFGAITDRDNEIFTLSVGKTGTPSTVGSKTLVFAVKERKDLDPEEIKKGLDPVRTSLQESKREEVFANWSMKQ